MTIDDDRHTHHHVPGPSGPRTSPLPTPDPHHEPDTLAATAVVVSTRGPNTGTRFPLTQPITSVGRHPHSDVFLDDITVSRRHAEFRANHSGVYVVDLASLRGTYVNGTPVTTTKLTNGDELQIGQFRLIFLSPFVSNGHLRTSDLITP